MAKLMKRHEKLLEEWVAQNPSALEAGHISYDDLPADFRANLEKVKWTETLWSDVERFLGDLAMRKLRDRDPWAPGGTLRPTAPTKTPPSKYGVFEDLRLIDQTPTQAMGIAFLEWVRKQAEAGDDRAMTLWRAVQFRENLELFAGYYQEMLSAAPGVVEKPPARFTGRAEGEDRGRQAFAEGRTRVPYHDPHLREAYTTGPIPSNEYVDGWIAGWTAANLEAPVPGMEEPPQEPEEPEVFPFPAPTKPAPSLGSEPVLRMAHGVPHLESFKQARPDKPPTGPDTQLYRPWTARDEHCRTEAKPKLDLLHAVRILASTVSVGRTLDLAFAQALVQVGESDIPDGLPELSERFLSAIVNEIVPLLVTEGGDLDVPWYERYQEARETYGTDYDEKLPTQYEQNLRRVFEDLLVEPWFVKEWRALGHEFARWWGCIRTEARAVGSDVSLPVAEEVLRRLSVPPPEYALGEPGLFPREKIEGGLGDGRLDSDFDPAALAKGSAVEMEHTSDPEIAKEIAKDHLTEHPDYYDRLEVMEREAESADGFALMVKDGFASEVDVIGARVKGIKAVAIDGASYIQVPGPDTLPAAMRFLKQFKSKKDTETEAKALDIRGYSAVKVEGRLATVTALDVADRGFLTRQGYSVLVDRILPMEAPVETWSLEQRARIYTFLWERKHTDYRGVDEDKQRQIMALGPGGTTLYTLEGISDDDLRWVVYQSFNRLMAADLEIDGRNVEARELPGGRVGIFDSATGAWIAWTKNGGRAQPPYSWEMEEWRALISPSEDAAIQKKTPKEKKLAGEEPEEPEEPAVEEYVYGGRARPLGRYTVPDGFTALGEHPSFPYGTVTYMKPLEIEDARHYALVRIPKSEEISGIVQSIAAKYADMPGILEHAERDPQALLESVGYAIDERNLYLKREDIIPLVLAELRKRVGMGEKSEDEVVLEAGYPPTPVEEPAAAMEAGTAPVGPVVEGPPAEEPPGACAVPPAESQGYLHVAADGNDHFGWARSDDEAVRDGRKWASPHGGLTTVFRLELTDENEGCWDRAVRHQVWPEPPPAEAPAALPPLPPFIPVRVALKSYGRSTSKAVPGGVIAYKLADEPLLAEGLKRAGWQPLKATGTGSYLHAVSPTRGKLRPDEMYLNAAAPALADFDRWANAVHAYYTAHPEDLKRKGALGPEIRAGNISGAGPLFVWRYAGEHVERGETVTTNLYGGEVERTPFEHHYDATLKFYIPGGSLERRWAKDGAVTHVGSIKYAEDRRPEPSPSPPSAAPGAGVAPGSGSSTSWQSPTYGAVRIVEGARGQRDVWHNIHARVGGRQERYGWNGSRWARRLEPPEGLKREIVDQGWGDLFGLEFGLIGGGTTEGLPVASSEEDVMVERLAREVQVFSAHGAVLELDFVRWLEQRMGTDPEAKRVFLWILTERGQGYLRQIIGDTQAMAEEPHGAKPSSIEFEWSESPVLPEHLTVTTFADADAVLREASKAAPSDGSYDKTAFLVRWEDGESDYEGRFDLQRQHGERTESLLIDHMRSFLTYQSGTWGDLPLAREPGPPKVGERIYFEGDMANPRWEGTIINVDGVRRMFSVRKDQRYVDPGEQREKSLLSWTLLTGSRWGYAQNKDRKREEQIRETSLHTTTPEGREETRKYLESRDWSPGELSAEGREALKRVQEAVREEQHRGVTR